MILPIPFIDFIPKAFDRDSKALALANKIDDNLTEWSDELISTETIMDPARVNVAFLEELGYIVNAGILPSDTETQKRKKIQNAVAAHKKRGSFAFDAKPKIDAIAMGNSQIIQTIGTDDFILVDDGTTPTAYYFAALGCDGLNLNLGISLIGAGDEGEIAGNIYIDVDNSALTAAQIDQIVMELEFDISPAYYRTHIGYMDISGAFIEYTVIG